MINLFYLTISIAAFLEYEYILAAFQQENPTQVHLKNNKALISICSCISWDFHLNLTFITYSSFTGKVYILSFEFSHQSIRNAQHPLFTFSKKNSIFFSIYYSLLDRFNFIFYDLLMKRFFRLLFYMDSYAENLVQK